MWWHGVGEPGPLGVDSHWYGGKKVGTVTVTCDNEDGCFFLLFSLVAGEDRRLP